MKISLKSSLFCFIFFFTQTLYAQNIVGMVNVDTVLVDHYKKDEMARTLREVVRAAESHDWKMLLELCDAEHKETQLEKMKMTEANYIAEILGVHYVDNCLPVGNKKIKEKDLNRITKVIIRSVNQGEIFEYDVLGTIEFEGWTSLELRVRIHWDEDQGRFWLYASVG